MGAFRRRPLNEVGELAAERSRRAFALRAVANAEREPTSEELRDSGFMRSANRLSLEIVMQEERRRGGGRRR